ncbi:MAG: FIST C-terminal domain-containing protein [Verrucomicrobiota bacterium]
MKISQSLYYPSLPTKWKELYTGPASEDAELVFAFGLRQILEAAETYESLSKRYPNAFIAMASTSGNLADQVLMDDAVVCTAIVFDHASCKCASVDLNEGFDVAEVCKGLIQAVRTDSLKHIFVLSDGGTVNGTTLSESLNRLLPADVTLSGGLAGDGTDFSKTVVGLNQVPTAGSIVAIGFSGESLEVGFGSSGGWSVFGPERVVTRSSGNVLFELDGQPALKLYKTYLGDQAEQLPASALRFPLCVQPDDGQSSVVRTILSIDEEHDSMTFAGDIPAGASVHFMRASYEDLIDGADAAAVQARKHDEELVMCVSCVGRRIVLGQRTEEELECVRETFGSFPVIAGFYSYGELAPTGDEQACQLHNQTMTITSFREIS